MMATTQPEDIPQTIRSRCQHFSFHAVKFDDILAQLKMIAGQEDVVAEDAALALLAEAGDGSMRDALSIMDQAIASAPTEDSKAVLSTAQIRELMGSVPNAVFERLLEAVAQGQSAALMEQINLLLNAGHSPSSLARQMVRYLRNTLMAKLGGEQTELLQISGDERARSARTALLFTEEELTRNLQIVLRNFDDLNYRKEQRFHLELGLLKLIHAQRLLPLEELLSAVTGKTGGSAPPPSPRASATPARAAAPSAPQAPSHSPFGPSGGAWNAGPKMEVGIRAGNSVSNLSNVTEMPRPAPVLTAEPTATVETSRAEAARQPAGEAMKGFSEPLTEGALAKAPHAASPSDSADAETLRQAVVNALDAAGHTSAAQLLGVAAWTVDGGGVRIETAAMGKKMLSLTVNAAAEKIIRQQLQQMGAPARFLIVPGTGASPAATAMAAPLAGSVQEAALANPLVQRAKEIFKAEVRSVVDLRKK
jgi:DNA polymerase-3 subunit gamma/tau